MYSTTDFRKGLKIEVDGIPYEIVDFQHFKPGKGGAMVRTKLRNILTGRMQDITFRSGEKVGKPDMESRDMQYLYRQDDELIFMDLTNYEQLQISVETTGGKEGFLKDGQQCRVLLYKGNPLDIDIPLSLVLEVTDTEPGAKGDTVSNVTKPATLETGLVVQVPIFVNTGDRIEAYGLTINSGTVVVENCKIDNYLSGVNINTSSSSNHSITVSGNVISNLGSNGDRGEAIQIAGSLEGKQVLITGNGIDNANVALQIYHNCGEAAEAFAISDNAITSTPVGINYEADETNAPSRVSVIANGNYFAPDGSRGVAMTVTSDVTTDVADQVVCDVYYTDASMDSTNEDTAPPWIWDDDDDYVPPIVPAQPSDSEDDNTTTIVACAAAAVVAALMAAFLILDRKR